MSIDISTDIFYSNEQNNRKIELNINLVEHIVIGNSEEKIHHTTVRMK